VAGARSSFFYASGAEGLYYPRGLIAGKKENEGAVPAQVVDRRIAKSLSHLDLDPIHYVQSQVTLPSLSGKTQALIVDFTWKVSFGNISRVLSEKSVMGLNFRYGNLIRRNL